MGDAVLIVISTHHLFHTLKGTVVTKEMALLFINYVF